MRQVLLSIGVPPHHWVQHNLPWLAVLALVFGFDRDDAALGELHRDR
jgi:hypothetical protein